MQRHQSAEIGVFLREKAIFRFFLKTYLIHPPQTDILSTCSVKAHNKLANRNRRPESGAGSRLACSFEESAG
jgi:hypothetical protein